MRRRNSIECHNKTQYIFEIAHSQEAETLEGDNFPIWATVLMQGDKRKYYLIKHNFGRVPIEGSSNNFLSVERLSRENVSTIFNVWTGALSMINQLGCLPASLACKEHI